MLVCIRLWIFVKKKIKPKKTTKKQNKNKIKHNTKPQKNPLCVIIILLILVNSKVTSAPRKFIYSCKSASLPVKGNKNCKEGEGLKPINL